MTYRLQRIAQILDVDLKAAHGPPATALGAHVDEIVALGEEAPRPPAQSPVDELRRHLEENEWLTWLRMLAHK